MPCLVIDDQPSRALALINQGLPMPYIAHGRSQIEFYLKHGKITDAIFLDHDMPLMDGMFVVEHFGLELVAYELPIYIWSGNLLAGKRMVNHLRQIAQRNHIEAQIYRFPFTSYKEYELYPDHK